MLDREPIDILIEAFGGHRRREEEIEGRLIWFWQAARYRSEGWTVSWVSFEGSAWWWPPIFLECVFGLVWPLACRSEYARRVFGISP